MIEKRMLAAPAVAAGMVLVVLAFGRGLISRFQDEVTETRREMAARLSGGGAIAPAAQEQVVIAAPASAERPASKPVSPPGADVSEPAPVPREEALAPPDPEAARDSARAEIAALGLLYDELVEVLVAIQEAQTDTEERWRARNAVAMARLSKSHDMRRFGIEAAGVRVWEVRGAWRQAWQTKARVEREIAEARETLARIKGG